MSAKKDLSKIIATTYNYLTVMEDLGSLKRDRTVLAKCICGKEQPYVLMNILKEKSKSCGCMAVRPKSHGMSNHILYSLFYGIRDRCYNVNCKAYDRYGGRGIKICNQWLNNPVLFIEWALSNGYKKGLSIERKKNDGDYEPSNCTWATDKEQCRHRSSNKVIEFNGQSKSVAEWAEEVQLPLHTLYKRLNSLKWPIDKALTTPKMKNQFV